MPSAFFWSEWLNRAASGTKACAAWFGEKRPAAASGRTRQGAFSAAVEKCKDQRKPEAFFGHRKAARSDEAASITLVDSLIFRVPRKRKMRASLATPTKKREGRWPSLFLVGVAGFCGLMGTNHAQHGLGKSALPLPVADAGRALFPQRSKNARISVSPKHFSGTARRRAAMRPRV